MPTARELLQQADALMRRNRGHSTQVAVPPERFVAVADMRSAADDVPMLTDAVDDIFADLGLPSVELESAVREVEKIAEETHHDPLAWLASDGTETSLHGVTGPAPDSADVVAVVSRKA